MRDCRVLRVFTRSDQGGNHLGVVADPDGLDGPTMQGIAADLGFSETIYIESSHRDVPVVRIFTPAAELPFAGHPLVGAAWVLGTMGVEIDRMRCGIGEVAFSTAGDRARIRVPAGAEVEPAPEGVSIARYAGLPDPVAAWWVRMPIRYLVLELASAEDVAAADPDPGHLGAGPSAQATYLVGPVSGGRVKARFFAPGLGVFEDPATGSAAAALAAIRAQRSPSGSLTIDQGDEMGHPSTIELSWEPGTWVLAGTVRCDEVREIDR
jgi:trans-2,3-dihydro-3-hydroxyanthranilate isomerase